MTLLTESRLEIRPLAAALGAEIVGVDLSTRLDAATVARLRQALLDHNVIFLRDQELAPPQLLALARRFGEVVAYPFVNGLPDCPLVLPIVKEPEDRANFGGVWHTDTAYLERPAMATMLYALETPPLGGDTMFANLYLAWETLSPGLRRTAAAPPRRSTSPASRSRCRPARRCAPSAAPRPTSRRPARPTRSPAATPRPAARRSTSASPTRPASRT